MHKGFVLSLIIGGGGGGGGGSGPPGSYSQARRQGGCRGVHVHPPFFSLIIACHFTEVLNCMSNRLRLHAILSISLTKPHLVQLINITPQSISSCDQYMHNYYSSHCIPIHMCTPPLKKSGYGPDSSLAPGSPARKIKGGRGRESLARG